MSKSIKLILFVLSAICAVCAPRGFSQEAPIKQRTVLTYVHDFLQVFYPEFFNKNYRVSFCVTSPGDDDWLEPAGIYFAVTSADVNPLQKLISSRVQTTDHIHLGGSIWLPPMQYGRIQEVHAYSDGVHEQQLEDLRRKAATHPAWSNPEIASALKQAGAHFGPADKDAFLNSLPLSKTERFLGKLKIVSVEFRYPKHTEEGGSLDHTLTWSVQTEAELPDGTHPRYTFEFEPFEGKLVGLVQSLGR